MKLISDIINELIDSEKSITSPLLKTKVLATRLKNNDLLNWVNSEINGYDTSGEVPEYRECTANVSGMCVNGYTQINDQPLPTFGLAEDIGQEIRQMDFYQGVSTLESLQKENKSGILEVVFSAELTAVLERNIQKMGNPYFHIVRARKYTSVNMVTQVLTAIRSKLLDFMLKLDEEFGSLTEIADLQKKNEKITTIMNQTIISTGDGNILSTGDNAKIKASITIQKGDKEALRQKLLENAISSQDADDLITILEVEEPDRVTGNFGPKVNSWIQKMIGKALDGSWQISLGAAGSLLAELLQYYYGLK